MFSLVFAKKRENPYFRNAKKLNANNSGSTEHRAVKFAILGPYRIERRDRHLCHVIGSDDAHRFGVEEHFDSVQLEQRTS